MAVNALPQRNWADIKETLNTVLPICEQFPRSARKKDDLRNISTTLEKAYNLASKDKTSASSSPVQLVTFEGFYAYHAHQCDDACAVKDCDDFVHLVLPCIVRLVTCELDRNAVTIPHDILQEEHLSVNSRDGIDVYEVKLPRSHVASLIACMFLCLTGHSTSNDADCPERCYDDFFSMHHYSFQVSKYSMVVRYFKRIQVNGLPKGTMTFRKQVGRSMFKDFCEWKNQQQFLCEFEVNGTGRIEDNSNNVLQTDFANEFIGGGVLNSGTLQEEIMFCACPELQASMLFMKRMKDNEAIHMLGFEPISKYTGYADSLVDDGPWDKVVERDAEGTPQTYVAAIDAVPYGYNQSEQYKPEQMHRDLNKAYIGFYQFQSSESLSDKSKAHYRPVATGNWGCGAFGGDPQLKSLLQWIAASRANCPKVIYYTFCDERVSQLEEVTTLLKDMNIAQLMDLIARYSLCKVSGTGVDTLFNFIIAEHSC